jgi:hypothetical protein
MFRIMYKYAGTAIILTIVLATRGHWMVWEAWKRCKPYSTAVSVTTSEYFGRFWSETWAGVFHHHQRNTKLWKFSWKNGIHILPIVFQTPVESMSQHPIKTRYVVVPFILAVTCSLWACTYSRISVHTVGNCRNTNMQSRGKLEWRLSFSEYGVNNIELLLVVVIFNVCVWCEGSVIAGAFPAMLSSWLCVSTSFLSAGHQPHVLSPGSRARVHKHKSLNASGNFIPSRNTLHVSCSARRK